MNIAFLVSVSSVIFAVFFTVHVEAGWFGYDTWEECMAKEPGKLMSRVTNPLPRNQAYQAAQEVCRSYPDETELRLRKLSDRELLAERNRAIEYDAEQRRVRELYLGNRQGRVDDEIERRKKEGSWHP